MQQLPTIPQTPQNVPGLSPSPSMPNDPQGPTVGAPKNKGEGWKSVLSTLAILIAAPLVALGLTTFVFQSYEVDGPSMMTTLSDHDRLIVLKAPRTLASITHKDYVPKRGNIIIFKQSGLQQYGDPSAEKQLIKRVIGVPGDHVVVKDGKITIYNAEHPDGFNPDEGSKWQNAIITTPGNVDVVIKEGEVFACGDNRTNSYDSRMLGPISAEHIVGKLVLRVFPLSQADTF